MHARETVIQAILTYTNTKLKPRPTIRLYAIATKIPTQTVYVKCATRTTVDSIHLLNAEKVCKRWAYHNKMSGTHQELMPQCV